MAVPGYQGPGAPKVNPFRVGSFLFLDNSNKTAVLQLQLDLHKQEQKRFSHRRRGVKNLTGLQERTGPIF